MARLKKEEQDVLVEAARNGDQDAIKELCDYVTPVLRRQLFRIVPLDDIDDVIQESLVRAFNKLDKFAGDSSFSTWTVVIAKNTALMLRRKIKRHEQIVVDSIDKTITNVAGQIRKVIDVGYEDRKAEQNLIYDTVHSNINKLSEVHQLVLRMSLEGTTTAELTKVLGTSEANAKSTLHRARKALAAEITRVNTVKVKKPLRLCKCGCGTGVPPRGIGYAVGHKKYAADTLEKVA
jgi:RNA polymerase sigma-70 factor (ECF subfamily)